MLFQNLGDAGLVCVRGMTLYVSERVIVGFIRVHLAVLCVRKNVESNRAVAGSPLLCLFTCSLQVTLELEMSAGTCLHCFFKLIP